MFCLLISLLIELFSYNFLISKFPDSPLILFLFSPCFSSLVCLISPSQFSPLYFTQLQILLKIHLSVFHLLSDFILLLAGITQRRLLFIPRFLHIVHNKEAPVISSNAWALQSLIFGNFVWCLSWFVCWLRQMLDVRSDFADHWRRSCLSPPRRS